MVYSVYRRSFSGGSHLLNGEGHVQKRFFVLFDGYPIV